ncbi:hypothetical protein OAO01_02675 [Oligoflexia bacterium]|nr:hypothetical protein [Oligoflexia bacterium]
MLEFELKPHTGVGPLKLGVSREAARSTMSELGHPLERSKENLDFYCQSSFHLEYVQGDSLSYIGTSFYKDFKLIYSETVNVFDTPARKLYKIINSGETNMVEFNDYELFFPDQIIFLWDAQKQYDHYQDESRPVFATVGIGDEVWKTEILRTMERGR